MVFGGDRGARTVTGPAKLAQDLRGWLLEPRGSDPMHPEYGSSLDGGALPDGTQLPTNIGAAGTHERLFDIETEIRRVLYAYQQIQLTRAQRETTTLGGKTTFAPGEILYNVVGVDVKQFQDVVLANIRTASTNGAGSSMTLATG